MRLTPEFVSQRSSHLNALKERELELRGLQIPVIENLASHQGTYDTLNLTDNSITVLGNIPLGEFCSLAFGWGKEEIDESPRLRQLHAAQNQISSISPSLPQSIPHIVTLVLSHNLIAALSTLAPLEHLVHLRHLALSSNPVADLPHYRHYTIYKAAKGQLHTLDYTRIKDAERKTANETFIDPITAGPNALALQLSTSTVSATAAVTAAAPSAFAAAQKSGQAIKGGKGRLMTPEEKRRVVEALTRAQTADEVRRLERMLAEGLIPEGQDGVEEAVPGANGVAQEA
ncbi:uncharacterized protein MKK02DRAFT_45502 [Dioszegia hungarica]|uniref:U2 small nuclear ribonucleoprotein A' n=1 Tax=Dioszegia hungarica TaxID=4972 RepID=A0AA38LV42_9TREE|nr:uncharacterized protein MKK02DRAFT_45502 [Dioszegia hungarica]KAI9636795.1 hypothetical protein MKK02DRAFT_45502 [Dioszegia hungarica]